MKDAGGSSLSSGHGPCGRGASVGASPVNPSDAGRSPLPTDLQPTTYEKVCLDQARTISYQAQPEQLT